MGRSPEAIAKTATTIFILNVLVVSIINLILASVSYATLDLDMRPQDDLLLNWSQGAVLDIEVAATCSSGFTPAITQEWPGTEASCYCGSGVTAQAKSKYAVDCAPFCSGTCKSNQVNAGCQDVPAVSSKQLSHWSSISGTPVQICLKRSAETFLENGLISGGTCPQGYTTCGSSSQFKFCTKEAKCPLMGFSILTVPADATNIGNYRVVCNEAAAATYNVPFRNCTVLSWDGGLNMKVLGWQRLDVNNTYPPMSQIRLNQYGMCDFSYIDNSAPGRSQFPPLEEKPTSCGNPGAASWSLASTLTETQLFNYNGLSSTISAFENYPGNDMYGYYRVGTNGDSFNWNLYQRPFIPWKADKRDRMQFLIDNVDKPPKVMQSHEGWFGVTVITSGLLMILLVVEALVLAGVNIPNGKGAKSGRRNAIYFLKFVCIPFQLWAFILCFAVRHFFYEVADNEYSAATANHHFQELAHHLDRGYKYTIVTFCLTVASLIIDCVLGCYARKAEKGIKLPNSAANSPTLENMNQTEMKAAEPVSA